MGKETVPLISKMQPLPFRVERKAFNYVYEEEVPLKFPLPEPEESWWQKTKRALGNAWDVTRFTIKVAPITLSTFFKVKVLNNDKKTTILGWLKGILLGAVTVFLPDLVNAESAVTLLMQVIAGGYGLAEIIGMWLTNKPEKTQ